jgi:YVTN family beta-propeller protein
MCINKTAGRSAILLSAFLIVADLAAAQGRSPALLVLNRDDKSLAIVDLQTEKIVGRVPTGEGPHGLALSTDGKLAFVTNTATRVGDKIIAASISVIDVAARRELRRVNIGPFSRPHGIVFAGGKVYFTAEGYKMIGCYNPATDQVEWMVGNGQDRTTLLVVSKDLNKIFAGNIASDTVTLMERISPPTEWKLTVDWKVTNIPVGDGPHGIEMSPDGKEVWTANEFDGTVSVIDVATRKVTQTLNVQTKNAGRLRFTGDGKRVLILHDGGLLVLDAATRKEIKRVEIGRLPEEVLLAPDGTRAYVAISGDHNIAIVDLKTLEVTGRLYTGRNPEGLAWLEITPSTR